MKQKVLLLLMLQWINLDAINIKLLQGTHTILPKAYAPFWGLVMMENGIAEQWYKLCPRVLVKDIKPIIESTKEDQVFNRSESLKILSEQKNSSMQDLVMQMFHVAGGTFAVTNAPNNPVRQFNPWVIGKILRMVHDAKTYDEVLQTALENDLVSLKLKDPSEKDFKARDFRPFVKALIGALKECIGKEAIYPENTAQNVLLGYMLAKSNTRADLEKYFTGFEGKPVKLPDEIYTNQDFENILKQKLDIKDISKFADFVCAQVYQEKYASALPKITSSVSVSYQGFDFVDCMESTVLNLANIVTYDSVKARMGVIPENLGMSSNLQKFYDTELYTNPAEVQNVQTHQAWTNIVENVQVCAYAILIIPGTRDCINVLDECDGVIPVDKIDTKLSIKTVTIGNNEYQVNEKTVGESVYWLVPKNSGLICFELLPTASNIIVLMNNLFDLKLYASVDEVLQQDFEKKHFQTMCQKLDWHVQAEIMDKIATSKSIEIPVQLLSKATFKIHLMNKSHGYVSAEVAQKFNIEFPIVDIVNVDAQVLAICLAMNITSYEKLISHESNIKKLQYFASVLNVDQRKIIIDLYMKDPVKFAKIDSYVAQLIISMSSMSDEHYQKYTMSNTVSLKIAQALLIMSQVVDIKNSKNFGLQYADHFIEHKLITADQACLWGEKGMNSSDENNATDAFRVLDSLVKKGLIGTEQVGKLFQLIKKGINSFYSNSVYYALEVLDSLVKKGLIGTEQVGQLFQLLEKRMNSSDENNATDAFRVLDSLVKKGLIGTEQVGQVFQLIKKEMNSSDVIKQNYAFKVLNSLVNKKLIGTEQVGQAFQWVEKEMNSSWQYSATDAFKVLNSLVEKELIGTEQVGQALNLINLHKNKFNSKEFQFLYDKLLQMYDKLLDMKAASAKNVSTKS